MLEEWPALKRPGVLLSWMSIYFENVKLNRQEKLCWSGPGNDEEPEYRRQKTVVRMKPERKASAKALSLAESLRSAEKD
jgi:hypothetical protein